MELYLKFFNEAYEESVDQTTWEQYRDNFTYTWR
jgi:hypothetical protein